MIRFDGLPGGARPLTPYLVVKNGDAMLDFYQRAFGAEIGHVSRVPDSTSIMHAVITIAGCQVFINDEFPTHGVQAPVTTGSTSSSIHIQVSEGVDELFEQAVAAGAEALMPPADMFWGDRFGMVRDPSGHKWSIGMTIPNPPKVSDEELREMMSAGSG